MIKIDKITGNRNTIRNYLLDSISIDEEEKYWNYNLDNLISSVYTLDLYYNDFLQVYKLAEKDIKINKINENMEKKKIKEKSVEIGERKFMKNMIQKKYSIENFELNVLTDGKERTCSLSKTFCEELIEMY